MSFRAAMIGHQGKLLGGTPLWEAFLGDLSLGIPRFLDSYK